MKIDLQSANYDKTRENGQRVARHIQTAWRNTNLLFFLNSLTVEFMRNYIDVCDRQFPFQ